MPSSVSWGLPFFLSIFCFFVWRGVFFGVEGCVGWGGVVFVVLGDRGFNLSYSSCRICLVQYLGINYLGLPLLFGLDDKFSSFFLFWAGMSGGGVGGLCSEYLPRQFP